MTEATDARAGFLSDFERFEDGLNGRRDSPIHPVRQAAIGQFANLGFPTTREEEWRFTNVGPIARMAFLPAAPPEPDAATAERVRELDRLLVGGRDGFLVVVMDGRYMPQLSRTTGLPGGVRAGGLADALREEPDRVAPHLARYASHEGNSFVALNTAFLDDGAFVYLPRDAALQGPLHLLFVASADSGRVVAHPRLLVVADENSQATLIESYVGLSEGEYFTNAVTEIVAGEDSVIDHYRVQQESLRAFHVATVQIYQRRGSRFSSHAVTLGGALARSDVNAVLDAEGIETTLNGLYLGSGRQHIDNHTRIDHAKPHCASHELYKGVLDGAARGVFNGKIYVHPQAQKTDAKQTNKTLLLSDDAGINTKPQLEIFADDVRCTHGATVGQLDPDALFYLRSRGIDREAARGLLTYAFASEVLEGIRVAPLKARLEQLLFFRLSSALAPEAGPA